MDGEINSIKDFNKILQKRIEAAKKGKIEVTNSDYRKLCILRFVIVGGNGAFNALYGWSLGYSAISCILLSLVMFSGDWALAVIHQITKSSESVYKKSSQMTIVGLVFMSLVAGSSFMIGIKHHQDVQASRVGGLETDLRDNQKKFRELGFTHTAERIKEIKKELRAERKRVGADYSSANALPMYISKFTGVNYEGVSVILNFVWIAVLLATGMSLSAQIGIVWCSIKEKAAGNEIMKQAKMIAKMQRKVAKVVRSKAKVSDIERRSEWTLNPFSFFFKKKTLRAR